MRKDLRESVKDLTRTPSLSICSACLYLDVLILTSQFHDRQVKRSLILLEHGRLPALLLLPLLLVTSDFLLVLTMWKYFKLALIHISH